ncbi:hypothetical protein [Nonomuraea sp. NPDC050310]|uniref:hypothetical protein n=1 Tax=Nonomuraea sp. NPDC050310 TaxID=3154935 RepID=UPI0033D46EB6
MSGCRSELVPSTARASENIRSEVQRTWRIHGETSVASTWDGETKITDVFVVDVHGRDVGESIGNISRTLRSKGWHIVEERPGEWIKAEKDEVVLTAEPIELASNDGVMDEPDYAEVINRARREGSSERFIVLEIEAADAWM